MTGAQAQLVDLIAFFGKRDENIPRCPAYPAGSAGYITLGVMMNRAQVVERLSLGRMVEAEAKPDLAGRRIFVEIRPIVSSRDARIQSNDGHSEPLLVRTAPNINVIDGYRVRYCSLNQGWENEPSDWDHYEHEQKWYEYSSVEELGLELNKNFGLALSSFQVPGNTESPL